MTSNLGARDIGKAVALGFTTQVDGKIDYDKMKEKVLSELKRAFRPELLNRLDEVIVFHELTHEEILQIVDMLMKRVLEQMESQDIELILAPEAKDLLAREGFDPLFGARPLRRAIQRMVEDPLSEKILSKEIEAGQAIRIAANEEGKVFFEKVEVPESGVEIVTVP